MDGTPNLDSPQKTDLNKTREASENHKIEESSPEKTVATCDQAPTEQNPFNTEYVSPLGSKAGTPQQDEIIEDYPFTTFQDKLLIPYIERYNGNICVRNGNH